MDASALGQYHCCLQSCHYALIVQQVIREVAQKWAVPPEVMPAVDIEGLARAAGSVLELVRLVQRELVRGVNTPTATH